MRGYYFFIGSNFEKWPFPQADMAGLGKYRMGRHGQIGVYRVYNMFN